MFLCGLNTAIGIMNKTFTAKEQRAMFNGESAGAVWVRQSLNMICSAALNNACNATEIFNAAMSEVSAAEVSDALIEYRRQLSIGQMPLWNDIEREVRKHLALETDAQIEQKSKEQEAARLRRVSLQLNNGCNLSCAYCGQGRRRERSEIGDEALFVNFCAAMDKLERLLPEGFEPVLLGGEPTLLSDDVTMRIIKRLEKYPRFFLLTNGTRAASLWHVTHNCWTVTHVTDWKKTMRARARGTHDYVKIVVTRRDIDALDAFLQSNGTEHLIVGPSMGGGAEFDCTLEEMERINTIVQKYGMPPLQIQAGPASRKHGAAGTLPLCDRKNTEWAIDCGRQVPIAATCCMSFSNAVPLDLFSGVNLPFCDNCTGRTI